MVVANHASYLDTAFIVTALPIELIFVAKQEFENNFFYRWFMIRLRTEFVERFDKQKSIEGARRLAQLVRGRSSVLFFPEGTFARMPDLLPFHMGAFVTAAEAGVPVLPVTLRGTRSKLRADSWFPRRGAVGVAVSAPIQPQGSDWAAAIKLRDAARESILRGLGEPDLAAEPALDTRS